jgi:hypothetical protein
MTAKGGCVSRVGGSGREGDTHTTGNLQRTTAGKPQSLALLRAEVTGLGIPKLWLFRLQFLPRESNLGIPHSFTRARMHVPS